MKARLPVTVLCVIALLLSTTSPAWASADAETSAVIVDAAVARPFTFVLSVVGSALFVATLPFTVPSGSVSKAADTLVVGPGKDTFTRPLGDLKDFLGY